MSITGTPLTAKAAMYAWFESTFDVDDRTKDFWYNVCKLYTVKKFVSMTEPAVKRLTDMMESPPKVKKTDSEEYEEDRSYDLDPQSYARFKAAFKLAAHFVNVGFAPSDITAEMMSGDRIDQFIGKLDEHESVCQVGKDVSFLGLPVLRQNTGEGRRKHFESLLDFASHVATTQGKMQIPVSVLMRKEPNPTRAPLEVDSVLGPNCATLAEKYHMYCPHKRVGLAGKRLMSRLIKQSLINYSNLLDLCEEELSNQRRPSRSTYQAAQVRQG